jgi:hypothetical protein
MKGVSRLLILAIGYRMDNWGSPVGWWRHGHNARQCHCRLSLELKSSVSRALDAMVSSAKWSSKGGHLYLGFGGHREMAARSHDGGFLLGSTACSENDVPVILWSRRGAGRHQGTLVMLLALVAELERVWSRLMMTVGWRISDSEILCFQGVIGVVFFFIGVEVGVKSRES